MVTSLISFFIKFGATVAYELRCFPSGPVSCAFRIMINEVADLIFLGGPYGTILFFRRSSKRD